MRNVGILELERRIVVAKAFRCIPATTQAALVFMRAQKEVELERQFLELSRSGFGIERARSSVEKARKIAKTAMRVRVINHKRLKKA